MGLKDDLERYREVGEARREDLSEFIKHGNLGGGDIKIPIKIISLPEFQYNQWDQGGVGQGDGDVGDPVGPPQPQPASGDGDEDGDGEPGEEGGEHDYYEMDPEEFAQELDEELGLDLEPKGKAVAEEVEGDLVDLARSGPNSTLDFERMFKKGLKRKLATTFDEDYVREVLKVDGMGPSRVFEWARGENIPVSTAWLETEYDALSAEEKTTYASLDDVPGEPRRAPTIAQMKRGIPLRQEDKRHKYPEITQEYEKNVVVVNIRDVSGSMREEKREMVERVFTPLDWYLTGKYDHAEFVYIAHDAEAWEVEQEEFFGIRSGGGTKISTAYDLAQELLDEHYPFEEWNRYVFCAGDGENSSNDSTENVIPLMESIDANLHGYLEVKPGGRGSGKHGQTLRDHFGDDHDNVSVALVEEIDEAIDAIYQILSTEDGDSK
jgi:hypothetical protein